MEKLKLTIVAGLVAAAAVLGAVAVTRTTALGKAPRQTANAAYAARVRQLNRFEAGLQRALARRPPKLPAMPARSAAPAPAPRVVYRRPPAIVVVHHTHHGDDGFAEAEGGDGGGGGD